MLPVLVLFTFKTPAMQVVLYALAAGLVIYGGWAGWRGAENREQAPARAAGFAIFSAVVAYFGSKYALENGAPLHTYGLMIATGFSLAVYLCAREAERAYVGVKVLADGTVVSQGTFMREIVMDLAFYCLVAGMVGARALFIIVNWEEYSKDPSSIFSLSGGLVFYGAFLGGAGVVYWYTKKHDINFLRFADLVVPSVSVAHAIGRFGCLSAGCCWGGFAKPGTFWALKFPGLDGAPWGQSSLAFQSQLEDHRLLNADTHQVLTQYAPDLDKAGHFLGTWSDKLTGATLHQIPQGAIDVALEAAKLGHSLPVYPTQLMESIGELFIFALLMLLRKYKWFHGQVLACWLMLYAILRTTTEMFRGDEERGRIFGPFSSIPRTAWYNISTSQFVGLMLFITGAVLWLRFGRRSTPSTAGATPAAA
jgi:phosphatidylglycerol:prolipoprotein diacylglycerol transferase